MADLVNIKTFLNRHEAELAKSLLAESDIEAIISADDLGGWRPHLSFGSGVKLSVSKKDADLAKQILKSYFS